MTEQQVLADFPQLMSEDIRACLAFAAECERKVVRIPVAEQHVLLFDEISRRGLSQTLGIFIWVAPMVGDWGLTAASDRAIWQYGRDHGLVIFTKDEDFQRFSILYGSPPKVIWIRLGNCSTADITRLLRERREAIARFLADEEAAFLALA